MLCKADRTLMHDFSGRCLDHLNQNRPFRLFLTPFHRFLEANVLKEIEKDRFIIEYAVRAFDAGDCEGAVHREEIFEKTKEVDAEFIRRVSVPLLSIKVCYDEIAHIRKGRIASLFRMVSDLLRNWEESISFPAMVRKTFTPEGYAGAIIEMLHLYNLETKTLSNSIKLPPPAGRAKDHLTAALFAIMETTAREIVADYSDKIYGRQSSLCQNLT